MTRKTAAPRADDTRAGRTPPYDYPEMTMPEYYQQIGEADDADTTQSSETPEAVVELPGAAKTLLRKIADLDRGHGVVFHLQPRRRYRLGGSRYTVNARTFYPLTGNGLITEDGDDVVRITEAGRAWVAAHAPRRRTPLQGSGYTPAQLLGADTEPPSA